MNRWLIGAAAALMALGSVACAEGVEDPQPAPAAIPEPKQVAETFSGEIPEGIDPVAVQTGVAMPDLPVFEPQTPPTW